MRRVLIAAILVLSLGPALAAERMQFWNLTSKTITLLVFAPVGSTVFGPNQTANDPDGTVDHDERLKIVGVKPGHYDVKVRAPRTMAISS